jgi:uncharacterized protein (TIGR02266 family)
MTDAAQIDPPAVTKRSRSGRASVEIVLDALSEHNLWANLAMEIERGGVFVATYRALTIGTQVDLCMTLPDGGEPVAACGVVRWTRPHLEGSDGVPGLGIAFVNLDTAARARIAEFAESVREPFVFELEEAPIRRRSVA